MNRNESHCPQKIFYPGFKWFVQIIQFIIITNLKNKDIWINKDTKIWRKFYWSFTIISHHETPCEIFTSVVTGGFHWSPNDRKSLQLPRTLLSILAGFSNAVVWTVEILPQSSCSAILFSRFLGIVPCSQTMMGITVTPQILKNSLVRSRYFSRTSFSFISTLVSFIVIEGIQV